MSYQNITLLAAIMTIVTSLLSINEHIRKERLFKTISVLLMYIIPIVFIQQIIKVTYLYKGFVFCYLIIYMVIKMLALNNTFHSFDTIHIKTEYSTIFKNHKITLFMVLVLLLSIHLYSWNNVIQDIFISDFSADQAAYYSELMTYHINMDMVDYLTENIFITLSILVDTANFFLMFYAINFISAYTYGKMLLLDKEQVSHKINEDSYITEELKIKDGMSKNAKKAWLVLLVVFCISCRLAVLWLRHLFSLF